MLLIGCHREALYHKNLKWLNLRKSPSALFLPASSNILHMHRYFIIRLNWILTQTRENPPTPPKLWRLSSTVGKYCSLSQEFFWNAHSVLREARKRGDWICISMNPCFLASNIFAFSCSSSHTAPFLYFPTPPSTSSSSPLFLLSLLLLLFFPRYPTDLYWAVCLRSPLGQWMFKILASCNLSITRFRPAWLPTTGGHKETFIFCWPFWIFYKTRLPVKHSTSIWPSCPQITARIFQVKYFNVTLMYWQNFCHARSQGFLLKSLGLNIFKDVL